LYSSARAQHGEGSDKAESVVRTASRVAFRSGLGLMVFLLVAARPLLRLYIGDKAASTPGLLDAASDYVSIRALSMPTSLLLGVLQSSLLGAKDSVTPLVAVLYATIVNIVGDYVLVKRLKMGLQGAAIATTVAQWASTYGIVVPARRKLVRDHKLGIFVKKPQDKNNKDLVTTKSFLAFAAPVLTLVIGKLAAFGFMTHSAAAIPGQPTPLAAHQIILSILFSCSPFLEVISQTAQTFLPPFLAPVQEHIALSKSRDKNYKVENDARAQSWMRVADRVSTQLLGIGFISAAAVASIASLVPAKFGYFLTSDSTVQSAVKPLAKYLWMGAFFWAPVAVAEGVLLARRELGFLAFVYLFSTALLPPALLQVKFRQGDVGQVWACFVAFQLFRATFFVSRVWGPKLIDKLKGKAARPVNGEATA
jgi:Na+-driven multidrug efflux pump